MAEGGSATVTAATTTSSPAWLLADAMLPDGSGLHVVIPDITRRHWSVNNRKFVLSANFAR